MRYSWVAVLILVGCGAPKASPFLADAPPLKRGEAIRGYGSTGGLTKQQLSRVYVEAVDVSRIADQPALQPVAAEDFRASAQATIGRTEGWGLSDSPQGCTARLLIAVTKLDPGSKTGRIIAGELGVGNAAAHAEAKLVDADTGRPVAAFASDLTDSGDAGFQDLGPNSTDRILRHMFDRFMQNVVEQVNLDLKYHSPRP